MREPEPTGRLLDGRRPTGADLDPTRSAETLNLGDRPLKLMDGRLVGTVGPDAVEAGDRHPRADHEPVAFAVLKPGVLDAAEERGEAASQPFMQPVGFILLHHSLSLAAAPLSMAWSLQAHATACPHPGPRPRLRAEMMRHDPGIGGRDLRVARYAGLPAARIRKLTPDAIDLGLDAAPPPAIELEIQVGEFGRGERSYASMSDVRQTVRFVHAGQGIAEDRIA